MLKRILKLSLIPKPYFPAVQNRFFTIVDSKSNDASPGGNTDDIIDIQEFRNKSAVTENLPTSVSVISLFVKKFNCTDKVAQKIFDQHEENIKLLTLSELTKQLEMFLEQGIDKEVLLLYPEIIVMNPRETKMKLEILNDFPKGKNENSITDYLPLMKLSVDDLIRLRKKLKSEFKLVPKATRIHYFSTKLCIEPYIASAVFANYQFLFRIPLRLLYANMEIALEYKIPATNILRDPWIFQYSPRKSRQRLAHAKPVREEKLMPWMIRCPNTRLESSLRLTSDIKSTLKEMDSEDVLGYLSKRLGFERSDMEVYMARFPAALKVRVTKIKKILDFLLDEVGYTNYQVAQVPRILCFGLEQMKERHKQLDELNYTVSSLIVYCFTRREFSKFVERISKHRHYLKRTKKPNLPEE